MAQPRVITGFFNLKDGDLADLAGAVRQGLYGNSTFPDPPVDAAGFDSAMGDFAVAMAEQKQGGPAATARKKLCRSTLMALLRKLAHYVGSVILENPDYGVAEILSSGFKPASTSNVQHALAVPNILKILNSGPGQLTLRFRPIANARGYEVQIRVDGATEWNPGGTYNSTRYLALHGLTPGGLYDLRVRALGGATGQSDWSNPVTHRSL